MYIFGGEKMNTNKNLYKMNKAELLAGVNKLPFQPRWKNRATKDELLGWLLEARKMKINEVEK